uniref:Uncharacterized protein n=1 Tax=Arion vulgaris TaxID=1028688 RepID=A0A0B7AS59_9EUPU
MSSDEVFEHSSADGLQILSSLAKISCFSSRFSYTASITKSTSVSFSRLVTPRRILRESFLCSTVMRLSFTLPCKISPILFRALFSNLSSCSTNKTGIPTRMRQTAIPDPIVPAPITATDFMTSGFVFAILAPDGSAHRGADRSAKNEYLNAADWALVNNSLKRDASRLEAASNGNLAAPRIDFKQFTGAINPLYFLVTSARAFSNSLSTWAASFTETLLSLRESRGFPITLLANVLASCKRFPSTSLSTIPYFSASGALTCCPEVIMFIATAKPVSRGRRMVPCAPGKRPICTSGKPTLALLSAIL